MGRRENDQSLVRPLFLGARSILMSAHDGAVDHVAFAIALFCQTVENALQYILLRPPREPGVHRLP